MVGDRKSVVNAEFQRIVDRMEGLLERLQEGPEYTRDDLHGMPKQGVYVLYEDGSPIYVGRSNNIPQRIREHSASGAGHEAATFAFKLYRGKIGNPPGTREEVQKKCPSEFDRQKQRVGAMPIRAVKIPDQREQTVFEIYAVLALGTTTYNTFETH